MNTLEDTVLVGVDFKNSNKKADELQKRKEKRENGPGSESVKVKAFRKSFQELQIFSYKFHTCDKKEKERRK